MLVEVVEDLMHLLVQPQVEQVEVALVQVIQVLVQMDLVIQVEVQVEVVDSDVQVELVVAE